MGCGKAAHHSRASSAWAPHTHPPTHTHPQHTPTPTHPSTGLELGLQPSSRRHVALLHLELVLGFVQLLAELPRLLLCLQNGRVNGAAQLASIIRGPHTALRGLGWAGLGWAGLY